MSSRPPSQVRWYRRLIDTDPSAEEDFGGPERVGRSGLRLIAADSLQNAGDQVVNAKAVLPWLLSVVGAPSALVGLLVPIRESGSMLPQAAITPWVVTRKRRARVWMLGAVVQGSATLAMAAAALAVEGLLAGVLILLCLSAFALGRALCSIAAKDVKGRTIPEGERGQVTGTATAVSGIAALALGVLLLVAAPIDDARLLALILGVVATFWFVGAVIYSGVPERAPDDTPSSSGGWWRETVGLLRDDPPFRAFVTARGLLLVSALAPPFIVTLAQGTGTAWYTGLGALVLAQGLAALIGGRVFGRWSDRSSRLVMVVGAVVASVVVLVLVGVVLAAPDDAGAVVGLMVATYFVVTLIHTGIRVARKTYVVDMAEGDQRTRYVAVSNTAMGIVLLVTGAISAGLATFGPEAALVFLSVLGLLGAWMSWRLPELDT